MGIGVSPQAAQLRALLAGLAMLATRCHDPRAGQLFAGLVAAHRQIDPVRHAEALAAAWQAAVRSDRRRRWTLVRHVGQRSLTRPCKRCGWQPDRAEDRAVLELCLDAACGLLVADVLVGNGAGELTGPLSPVAPAQRWAA